MFERTAAAMGVAPNELLHIGDLEPTDIAGIHAVGGVGALFAGANDRFAENTTAEYVFHHWSEFLDILPGIE
jgi:FMN phosphatase YigB (HAD superfamily)